MIKALVVYSSDNCQPCFVEFLDILPSRVKHAIEHESFQQFSDVATQEHDLSVYCENCHSLKFVVYTSRGMCEGESRLFLHTVRELLAHLCSHLTERSLRSDAGKIKKLLSLMVNHGKLVETRPNHLLQLLEVKQSDEIRRNH